MQYELLGKSMIQISNELTAQSCEKYKTRRPLSSEIFSAPYCSLQLYNFEAQE